MRREVRRVLGSTRLRAVLILGVALAATMPVLALDPVNSSFFGGAIKGYDPVAYFTDGKPVKGSRSLTFEWRGATWRFATREHLELFRADPEKYAPQYGGYCAWAMAQGDAVGVDPRIWTIVDGRLYLNYNADVQKKWKADIPGYIERADLNWTRLTADQR